MKITTWNINSVRLRIGLIKKFVELKQPDILCLQETKVVDDLFPVNAFKEMGYSYLHFKGMKSYNGVAIISKIPFINAKSLNWCGKDDKRYCYVTLPNGIELHNFYVPAGGDIPDPAANDKFAHKLNFIREMKEWSKPSFKDQKKAILVGDLNIAPFEMDVWSHKQLLNVVSHTPVEVEGLTKVLDSISWIDVARHFVPKDQRLYSWWSYRARDWEKSNRGRRLDHIWTTSNLKGHLGDFEIFKEARGWEKPSDHVPVTLELKDISL